MRRELHRRLAVSVALLLLCGIVCPAAAQGPPELDSEPPPIGSVVTEGAKPQTGQQASFVSLFTEQGGHRLMVDYPWSRHEDASIEVRLVSGEQPSAEGLRPLGFATKHFRGDIRMQIYDVQDAGAGGVAIRTLEADGAKYEVIGGRNRLGKPATCIVRKFPKAEPPPGAHAVYCLLDAWSINRKLLSLELPRGYFAPPGKLKIWFLRGGTVLWSQTLDWPGTK